MVDKFVCEFTSEVRGNSMSPLITTGSLLKFNRCFDESDLTEGTMVVIEDNSNSRFGIIRHLLPLDPTVYKVSDEKAPQLLHDVTKEEIIAVNKNLDTSTSVYQPGQENESFILNANDFLSDFYLAKIPRGMGIETSTVKKTILFSRQNDKFCFVIVPHKKLTSVGIEIIDTKAQRTVFQAKNIVFDTNPIPNINCQEFGSGQGMLNLDPGIYRYRFLVSHQALTDIQFEVK